MTNEKEVLTQNESTDTNRRKALKLAAGGGLVSGAALTSNTWTKPVVNAVLLPAHAQTSLEEGDMDASMDGSMDGAMDGPPATFSGLIIGAATGSALVPKSPTMDRNSILDLFVTPVNAGGVEGEFEQLGVDTIEAFATQTGDDAFDFQFRVTLFPMSCNDIISKDEVPPGLIFAEPILLETDSISLFFEISASGGSGVIADITNCDETVTQGFGFDYSASDETIEVSNITFDVDGFLGFGNPITLMPGGEPLVAADCTLCPGLNQPAPEFDTQ